MADYRQIHTSIWDDDWFCQLSSDEKVVFIWFFSNRRASVSGLYKYTEFICSRETSIPLADVSRIIGKLVTDKKIEIEGEWVWVKNLRKYNDSNSPNSNKRIASDLSLLPDNGLKKSYIAYYKPLVSPLPTPTEPLTNPSQNREQEQGKRKKSTPPDLFVETQRMIESVLCVPPVGEEGVTAINQIMGMGATMTDIEAGYKWLRKTRGTKPIQYYSSLVGPVRTAITKRLQSKNVPTRTPVYSEVHE